MFSDNEKRYKSILNNLLDVSPNDKVIFTKVDNTYFFDFYKLFGEALFNEIYTKNEFNIDIIEEKLKLVAEQIKLSNSYENAIEILTRNNVKINDYKLRQLKKDFKSNVNKIVDELILQYQKQSVKWAMFLNRAKEIHEQTNIWPIHIGFMYVKVNIDGKSIYAPLFLKEANLTIENSRPKLSSKSEIKPNEKLLFLLNNANFDINTNISISNLSIKKLFEQIKEEWKQIYPNIANINAEFTPLSPENITNESLEFCPGIILGLFQPSGGYIRNRMMEIIKNDELNKIIPVEFKKQVYTSRIEDFILDPKKSLFKITPTNFSQDKAIASSLLQNTVIWGPPGTGKSQTIVNLLANILIYGKTALVCSQKKAALEVIRNRMGELKQFCLFMLNVADVSKKTFYKPLREYIDYLEHFNKPNKLKALRILSTQELKYINNIAQLANEVNFKSIAKVLPLINKFLPFLNQNNWEVLLSLPEFLSYPAELNFETLKQLQKWMLHKNKLSWKLFSRKRKAVLKYAKIIFENFGTNGINLSELKGITKDLEFSDYQAILHLISILPPENKDNISDQNEIRKFVAKLIVDRYDKLSEQEKADYGEFALTIRIGKTEPYKFINKYAHIIKKLFPVIIATPDVDLSAWEKNEFDYAILDESSQIFIEKGLPVLYLAKTKVLAGDDQQMKPSNWFGIRVSDDESVYGITESLLDYGIGLGVHSILLNKNYRSHQAALMTFSSKHFYNSKLDVIDSANANLNENAIEVIEANGQWIDSQNLVEEQIVLDLVNQNLSNYSKIILLCFNAKQQESITKRIFEQEPNLEKALRNNQLLLRNIENIQGDEADLVIATLGYDSSAKIYSTYVGRPGGKNALNVAISRAKDKMIVVKSIHSQDVVMTTDNDDVLTFKKWLEFLELSEQERREFLTMDIQRTREIELDEPIAPKSELFTEINDYLTEKISNLGGINLIQDFALGTINVDFMITSHNGRKFAIMVDDYAYANSPLKYLEFNDLNNFIKSKNYNLYVLDRIKWEQFKSQLNDLIVELEPTDNKPFEQTLVENIEQSNVHTNIIEDYEEEQNQIEIDEDDNTLTDEPVENIVFSEDTIELASSVQKDNLPVLPIDEVDENPVQHLDEKTDNTVSNVPALNSVDPNVPSSNDIDISIEEIEPKMPLPLALPTQNIVVKESEKIIVEKTRVIEVQAPVQQLDNSTNNSVDTAENDEMSLTAELDAMNAIFDSQADEYKD
ncbi:DEAD/DEAH box helicase [Mycoplasma simbae]|uniref:DEAD/DEAH box helicase n=1 Tax=Mycoplasma simbae TaxID=36744 RepID=UPI0004950D30|nr:DEAD/DEAH box helicase [Mycoplasma simbae]